MFLIKKKTTTEKQKSPSLSPHSLTTTLEIQIFKLTILLHCLLKVEQKRTVLLD